MGSDHQTPRAWRQFSIRSLLLVMLLAAVYFAGWMNGKNSAESVRPFAIDFDMDGDLDLDLLDKTNPTTLYVNQADGTFTERSGAAALSLQLRRVEPQIADR